MKIDISADIHGEKGRIFRIEACQGMGECHVFIEDDKKYMEEEIDGDIMNLEESRAIGGKIYYV